MKHFVTAFAIVAIGLVSGCDQPRTKTPDSSGVIDFEKTDQAMNAAMQRARSTLGFFEDNWQTMKSDNASLKFAVETSAGDLEHIWFSPISIEGDSFTARCANEPVNVPALKFGDVLTVKREKVSDWMILDGNRCFGGFTIRVMANKDPDNMPAFEFLDPEDK